MSRRGKSTGKGFLLKLIIAALTALVASALFKKKVLAPAPANDYRLPPTPPPNPSAAMGPEESTPLTEQEKIRLQGSAATSSATGASTVEAATAVDEAAAAEPEAVAETQSAEASGASSDEPEEDESKSKLEMLEGFDFDLDEGETGDEGEASSAGMGIAAAEAPADALTSGEGFVYPAEGTNECPEDYPIKGNASSRIYHRPGESSYEATIPEICFASDTAADAAGYRQRKR
jgi:hypothetical protein